MMKQVAKSALLWGILISGVLAVEWDRELDQFFSTELDGFDEIMSHPVLRMKELQPTDGYFLEVLRENAEVQILMRVNSRGVRVNYAERGRPIEYSMVDVSRQRWFASLADSQSPYQGVQLKGPRPQLFWANPLFVTLPSGRIRFGGAVVAKLDLRDMLYRFAGENESGLGGLTVALGKKNLYTHNRQKGMVFERERLSGYGLAGLELSFARSAWDAREIRRSPFRSIVPRPSADASFEVASAKTATRWDRFKQVFPRILDVRPLGQKQHFSWNGSAKTAMPWILFGILSLGFAFGLIFKGRRQSSSGV